MVPIDLAKVMQEVYSKARNYIQSPKLLCMTLTTTSSSCLLVALTKILLFTGAKQNFHTVAVIKKSRFTKWISCTK